MATPASHAASAAAAITDGLPTATRIENPVRFKQAQVHAVLSTKAGTGTNYTNAEAALAESEASPDTSGIHERLLAKALAYAFLAA